MEIAYGDYVTPIIPNTTMQEVLRDGILAQYRIQAVDGYVLHDNRIDGIDDFNNIVPRFKLGDTTVSKTYDFDSVTNGTFIYTDESGMEVTIPVEMIGEYEFYTLSMEIYKITPN